MRSLDIIGIRRFVLSSYADEAYVLLVKSQEVETFYDEDVLLRNACIIFLQNNQLASEALSVLWKKFPNAWWVDLSFNRVSNLMGKVPKALGLLNLYGNDIKTTDLPLLADCHILRLHVPVSFYEDLGAFTTVNALISSILPNVWAVNDDFITSADRREATQIGLPPRSETSAVLEMDILSNTAQPNVRAQNVIRVVQNCPPRGKFADYFRLEILLDEYLQEACYFNCFAAQIHLQNNSSHRTIEPMPFVDVYALMMLPHRTRLDLAVVLTAALLFHIPRNLLRDALVISMGHYVSTEDIDQMYALPTFAKTALVCLLRRVTAKEALEWQTIHQFCPKPARPVALQPQKLKYGKHPAPPPSDYLTSSGFDFLRPVKEYLEQAIEVTVTDPKQLQAMVPFSELELEILNKLPDVPTRSSAASYFKDKAAELSRGTAMSSASYREWIPFAARHTVLLLTKAPACPPLTRPQQSKAKQELYIEMLPLLRAANMTMNDLDLAFTGPGKDGRMLNPRTVTSGTSMKVKSFGATLGTGSGKSTVAQTALSAGSFGKEMALLGGSVLPYGVGLPNAVPGTALSWKVQEVPRDYHRAWDTAPPRSSPTEEKDPLGFTDDLESHHSANFFLTEDGPKPPHAVSVRTTSNLSTYLCDIGAPAPLPRNRSIPALSSPTRLALQADGSTESFFRDIGVSNRAASPPRTITSPYCPSGRSDGFEIEGINSFQSLAVTVPTTTVSTNHSVVSEQTPIDERSLNVDAEESVFTHQSVDSEPFGLLSLASPSGEQSPQRPVALGIADVEGEETDTADVSALPLTEENLHHIHQPQQKPSKAEAATQRHRQQHNQHPHLHKQSRTAAASGGAVRPEHVSVASAHPVLGFSADANWTSKFLLAPPSAVARSNFTMGRNDPANLWNFIEYAPVIVHSPSKRISQDTLKTLLTGPDGSDSTAEVGVSAEDAVIFCDTEPPSRLQSVPAAKMAHQMPTVTRSSALPKNDIPQDLTLQLLKEMGTVRNIRNLELQNERIAAQARYLMPEEDASLSLSQSQEPSLAFWEEDDDTWAGSPGRHSSKRTEGPDESSSGVVFLTGVQDQGSTERPEEQEDHGEEEAMDSDVLAPLSVSPPAGSRKTLPRSYSEMGGAYSFGYGDSDDFSAGELSGQSTGAPVASSAPQHVETVAAMERMGRPIPIPIELLEDPLKELRHSVSTVDILMKKTNYSNIHVNSQSVEFGNKGINGNVGSTWYPLMAKNVYRLSHESLDLDKLLGPRLVKPSRARKTPVLLKPLKVPIRADRGARPTSTKSQTSVTAPAASTAESAVGQDSMAFSASVIEVSGAGPVTTESLATALQAGLDSHHEDHTYAVSADSQERELSDPSDSAYFKSLFKSHTAVQKSHKKRHIQPLRRSLPKIVTFQEAAPHVASDIGTPNTGEQRFTDEIASRPLTTRLSNDIAQFSTSSTTDHLSLGISASLHSDSPLMAELKEAVHHLLLSHPATPRCEQDRESPGLSPPTYQPGSSDDIINRYKSGVYVMGREGGTEERFNFSTPVNIVISGKPLLPPAAHHGADGDDISVMHSVGSALSLRSSNSMPARPHHSSGVAARGARGGVAETRKMDWDNFTDSTAYTSAAATAPTAAVDINPIPSSAPKVVARRASVGDGGRSVSTSIGAVVGTAGGTGLRLTPTVIGAKPGIVARKSISGPVGKVGAVRS